MTEEILYKYVSGNASESEIQEIQNWASESEERKKELARIKNTWILSGLKNAVDVRRKEEVITNVLHEIRMLNRQEAPKSRFIPWVRYAAAIILIIGLSGITGYFFNEYQKNNAVGFVELTIPFGDRSDITLPDKTKVQLNSGTSLRFESSRFSTCREVTLNGEAFFEVTHDEKHPFIVKTNHMNIEVLGTSFNVSSYEDDAFITTFLKSGRVKILIEGNDEILLKPNEAVQLNKKSNELRKLTIKDGRCTDWTAGILTIKGETIEELTKKLTRKYGVRFEFGDDKARMHTYTGTIHDEALEDILEALKYASAIDNEREGNIIKLYSIKQNEK